MRYLAKCVPHHNSDLSGYKCMIEVPEGDDPLYAALLEVWRQGGIDGTTCDYDPPTPEQWAQIMAKGLDGDHVVLEGVSSINNVEPIKFSFTYRQAEPASSSYAWFGTGNINYNPEDPDADGPPDKQYCTWVHVEPFIPNPQRIQELNDLTYDELVELVLELEAETAP